MASEEDRVLIVDFGSQFTQLIARRVREIGVYCEIFPWTFSEEEFRQFNPKGIILSGSSESTLEDDSPRAPAFVFESGLPIFGICYGMQLMAVQLGGSTRACGKREFGSALVRPIASFLEEVPLDEKNALQVWMSHGDQVDKVPEDFIVSGETDTCPVAAMCDEKRRMFGVQFHCEVTETKSGEAILKNFLTQACQCKLLWTPSRMAADLIEQAKVEAGPDGDVLLGLSGGVDSSVVAMLLHKALGSRLKCIMVETGLLRLNEAAEVTQAFKQEHPDMNVTLVDASEEFLSALRDVEDPEAKRKTIGALFIDVFTRVALTFSGVKMLAQGTIYPDVIESAHSGTAMLIKSHHNVGGLPEKMNLKLLEPIRKLFKDEVRRLGEELGLPHAFVWRHPFPGPGLGVRIVGKVSREAADKLRHADSIFIEELRRANWYEKTSQAFAVLLPCKSVAVKGDARCYEQVIALRCVQTVDFMTATVADLPTALIKTVARRIANEVHGVSRVLYDFTDKPPGTIEWE